MNDKENKKKIILKRIESGKRTINKLMQGIDISQSELKNILLELKDDLLVQEKNGNYFLTTDYNHKIGILNITQKGNGIVKVNNENYFVDGEFLNNAIHGDTVLIKILDPMRRVAVIEDNKSSYKSMVGTVYLKNKKFFVNLDNPMIKVKIKLEKIPSFLKNDDKVLVKFFTKKNVSSYKGDIIEVLGNKDEVGVDILSMIKELSIDDKISEEELEEVKKIKNYVDEADIGDRVDLREEKFFTIDGKDSKDFDDAVGIKLLDNNHYLLRVNIADVDHYVKEGSLLDRLALKRGATTYLCDRTIPMLRYELSNGICSLNPNVDRLTLTYEMEYDENGILVDYNIYLSVINSKQRMNYDDVEDVLVNEQSEKYHEFQVELRLLKELTDKLYKNRVENGYIDINRKERKIDYDRGVGKIKAISLDDRKNSEKLIEESMIAANKCGTLFAKEHDIQIIRRVQDDMPREELEKQLEILAKIGFKRFDFSENYSTNDMINEVLNYYKDNENIEIIVGIITNKNRAYYSEKQMGHSNLIEKDYAHLTSPIRRYPDLYSSRQIKMYLKKQDLEMVVLNKILDDLNNKIDAIRQCAHRTEGLKLAEYYQENDEVMPAKIINLNERFMTIMLEDLTTSIILKRDLRDYKFDENIYSYVHQNGNSLKVGDDIFVEVDDIDKYFGRTNFRLCKKLT